MFRSALALLALAHPKAAEKPESLAKPRQKAGSSFLVAMPRASLAAYGPSACAAGLFALPNALCAKAIHVYYTKKCRACKQIFQLLLCQQVK
jgi:hypothetical protein